MDVKFDYFNKPKKPIITLHNPTDEALFILNNIKNKKLSLKFNDLSEFTFESYKYDGDGVEYDYYDFLEARRLVKVQDVGVFIITDVRKHATSSIFEKKEVVAKSLEKEMARKNIGYLDGTYKFYDAMNTEGTILQIIIDSLPNWKLGYVDPALFEKYRTFLITNDTSVYNFMISEVSQAYQCIFKFNTLTMTIDVYAVENAVSKTNILLTYENLIKSINIDENNDEFCTCLSVYGSEGVDIGSVNPMGIYIYDFSYYKNLKWMSQDLIDAITAWETKLEEKQVRFSQLLVDKDGLNSQLSTLKLDLELLEIEKEKLETVLSTQVTGGQPTEDTAQKIKENAVRIGAKKSEIEAKETQIKTINVEVESIQDLVSFKKNFTKEQYDRLSRFIVENTYQDNTFVITDNMTDSEAQKVCQDLLEQGKSILKRLAQPRFSFSCESINFLNLIEYKDFISELELGSEITIKLEKGLFAYPVLLGINYSLDGSDSGLELVFGNRLRLQDDEAIYEELFGKTISNSSTIETEKYYWGNGGSTGNKLNEYINSSLDASKQDIINNSNQETLIDHTGIRCRKLLENGNFAPNEVWITQNVIGFTRNNWQDAGMVLGDISFNGHRYFGLNAELLIGRTIIGQQLEIQNENMSFRVTGDKVIIKNGSIIMSNDELLEDYINNKDSEISDNLNKAITDVYDDMEDMRQAIEDGEIVIFYEPRAPLPTDGKDGDMWYDTSVLNGVPKNEAYLKKNKVWNKIKDSEITKALSDANKAQETADGKIVTFYQATMPTNGSNGDLWVNTSQKNKLYRHNGSTFVPVQDGAIKDAQDTANDAKDKINNVIDPSTGNIKTDKLIGTIEAGKNNIELIDSANSKAMKLNEVGILIANSKTGSTWNWKTAISGDGIVADYIKANGTITGCNLVGGSLNIGSGAFTVSNTGAVKASNLALTGGSISITDKFSVSSSGVVTAKDLTLTGGSINVNNKFKVDRNGDVYASSVYIDGGTIESPSINGGGISGTSININGNFTVDTNGNVFANTVTLNGETTSGINIKSAEITGGVITQESGSERAQLIRGRLQFHNKSTNEYIGTLLGDVSDGKLWLEGNKAIKLTTANGGISLEPRGGEVHIGNCQFMGTVRGCKVVFG